MDFFILRPEHEAAFHRAGVHRFARRTVRWLRDEHPARVAGVADDELLARVESWIALARDRGLKTERQMYRVCEAAVHLEVAGIKAASDRRFLACLDDRTDAPEERSLRIRSRFVRNG